MLRVTVFTAVVVASIVGVAAPGSTLPAVHPTLAEYPASDSPFDIVEGPDGNMWFTSDFDNKIGRITPTGQVTLFDPPTPQSIPLGIDVGPDGNLWFVESGADQIGRITPGGSITEFPLPTSGVLVRDIAQGPDGNMWFTELFGNQVGRITMDGTVTEYPIPTADSHPIGITAGPDGRLWFTEADADKIGRVTTDGSMSELRLARRDRDPTSLAVGPDGNVWVAEVGVCCSSGYVSRITTTGVITEFPVSGDPSFITSFRGALWFTEPNADMIGQMSTLGSVSLRGVPRDRNFPVGIATGPSGTLWFCENDRQVAEISFG